MKQYLRNRVSKSASYIEIILSIFIIIGILIVSVILVRDLVNGIINEFKGDFSFDFRSFIGLIMQLIIGVEFVKMLSKHTPESTIEVLMFVVARKIIIDDPDYWQIGLGILAIGVLFFIKFYFTQKTNPEGCILEGETRIPEMNMILHTRYQSEDCSNVRDMVQKEMELQRINLVRDSKVIIGDHIFKVYAVNNGNIDAVEVFPVDSRKFRWPWQSHSQPKP